MTKIDRYILVLFLRTVLVCFLSLAGIFIIFHAFTALDDILAQMNDDDQLVVVLAKFYGPYLVLMFDMTGTIITLMAFLFTAGWLRRTGELTATLSAGVSHGRIFRPMVIASVFLMGLQLFNREFVIPNFRDSLDMKAKNLAGNLEQAVSPTFDQVNGVLIEGDSLRMSTGTIQKPNIRLYADFGDFGELLIAQEAVWCESPPPDAGPDWQGIGGGYRLKNVQRPESVDALENRFIGDRPVLLAHGQTPWLAPGEMFVVTTVHPGMIQTNETGTRLASIWELITRIRNPAVDSSLSLKVFLHERIVRAPLDLALVLMVLPMVVNRNGKKLFVLIGMAFMLVVGFFGLKTITSALGGSGTLLSPTLAAWLPLLILGPLAYVRLRAVQTV